MKKTAAWIAVVLSMVSSSLGLLYARRPLLAIAFGAASLALGIAAFVGVPVGSVLLLGSIVGLWLAGVILAYRSAKRAPEGVAPWYARWYGLAGISAVVILTVTLFRVFLYEPFRMRSSSMAPSVPSEARLVVQKHGFGHLSTYGLKLGKLPASAALKRGDIIAFDYPRDPKQTYIKRIIGLPGDRVTYRDKEVFVNGQSTRMRALAGADAEPGVQRHLNRLGDITFETLVHADRPPAAEGAWEFAMRERCVKSGGEVQCEVPAGHYFVMGDNRDNSFDSRYWGFLRADLVVGKVVKVYPSQ
ncbi:MAG: signal peptidase I [Gammaproteobacteria bacterium]